MAQAKGALSKVVIDFETAIKTPPSPVAGIVMPFNYPFSLGGTRDLKKADNTNRGRRDAAQPWHGNMDVKGGATVPLDVIAIGYWLRALLGSPTTTGPVGDLYTHVFKPGASVPSLIIDKEFANISTYLKNIGVRLNKFGIDWGGDGELVAKLDFVGCDESTETSAYDGTPTELTLTRFQNREVTLKEGGASILTLQSGKFEISNNLVEDDYVQDGSNGVRYDVPEGEVTASGGFKAVFLSAALLTKALDGTESSHEVKFTRGTNTLTFSFPELLYAYKSPEIVKGGLWVEPAFEGYYEDGGDNAALVVTLVNTHTAYA